MEREELRYGQILAGRQVENVCSTGNALGSEEIAARRLGKQRALTVGNLERTKEPRSIYGQIATTFFGFCKERLGSRRPFNLRLRCAFIFRVQLLDANAFPATLRPQSKGSLREDFLSTANITRKQKKRAVASRWGRAIGEIQTLCVCY